MMTGKDKRAEKPKRYPNPPQRWIGIVLFGMIGLLLLTMVMMMLVGEQDSAIDAANPSPTPTFIMTGS